MKQRLRWSKTQILEHSQQKTAEDTWKWYQQEARTQGTTKRAALCLNNIEMERDKTAGDSQICSPKPGLDHTHSRSTGACFWQHDRMPIKTRPCVCTRVEWTSVKLHHITLQIGPSQRDWLHAELMEDKVWQWDLWVRPALLFWYAKEDRTM